MPTRRISAVILPLLLLAACTLADTFRLGREDQGEGQEGQYEVALEDDHYLILDALPERTPLECPALESPFITDLEIHQGQDIPEPEPRVPFQDPVYGTCLIRVTDRESDPLNPGDPSRGLKNEYARVQSFNADESLLLVRSSESFWYVYDAHTLQLLGEVPAYVEPRWDAENPTLLYFTEETRLLSYDIQTGEQDLVRDFAADVPGEDLAAVWTRHEGSPSFDTRWWGFVAQDQDWEAAAFLVHDLRLDQVSVRVLPRSYSIDHVTISPLGSYFLASFDNYCSRGQLGTDADPCGFMVYDRGLENGRGLLRIIGHYDTALDATGKEVVVYQDIDTDQIALLDLESGKITPLLPIDFSHTAIGFHFSGRASNLPGWALVSTYNGGRPRAYTWMDDVVFALELKPGGRVVRLAETHSLYDESVEKDYWAEPHASVNRDFTRILFTSNWGRTGTEEIDLYLVVLPAGWAEDLP